MKQSNTLLCFSLFLAVPLFGAGRAEAQVCVEPPVGLISWWTGDGDVTDVQSNFDAELAGAAGYAPGLVGDAFLLDGTSSGQEDRVLLPAEVLNGLGDFTVEFWINTVDPDQAGILSGANGTTGGDNELLLFQLADPTDISLGIQGSSSGRVPISIADGLWHHIAISRQADRGRMHIDGGPVASYAVPTDPLFIEPGGLMLGQEQDCLGNCFHPSQAFDGLIDEVSVYAKALSDEEILAIAQAGSAGKCMPEAAASNDELLVRIEQLEHHVGVLIERVTELESQTHSQYMSTGHFWRLLLRHMRERR